MDNIVDNPYAVYVHCDGAMNYDSKNTSGIGIEIVFPDFVDLNTVQIFKGSYENANIERVELEAILQGMVEILRIYRENETKLRNIGGIIITTDRAGLVDRTNPFQIKKWKRSGWKNYEGKEIKNKDLLNQIDKIRIKINGITKKYPSVEYIRRKKNKQADKLARIGKIQLLGKRSIGKKGIKIAKRMFDGDFVNYDRLENKKCYNIRIYKKETVGNRIEISGEFIDSNFFGRKITIYTHQEMDNRLHRHHIYKIRIKKIFRYYIEIYKTTKEIKK